MPDVPPAAPHDHRPAPAYVDADRMWRLHANAARYGPEVAAWFHGQRAHFWWREGFRRMEQYRRDAMVFGMREE